MSKSRLNKKIEPLLLDAIANNKQLVEHDEDIYFIHPISSKSGSRKYAISKFLGIGGQGSAFRVIAFVKENPITGKLKLIAEESPDESSNQLPNNPEFTSKNEIMSSAAQNPNYVLKFSELKNNKENNQNTGFSWGKIKSGFKKEINLERDLGHAAGIRSKRPYFQESTQEIDASFLMQDMGEISLEDFIKAKYKKAELPSKLSACEKTLSDLMSKKPRDIAKIVEIKSKIEKIKFLTSLEIQKKINDINLDFLSHSVIKACAQFHLLGLSHRDIKPDNFRLRLDNVEFPKVTLVDMGGATDQDTFLANGQTIFCTPDYMDPAYKMPKSEVSLPLADQYSLGITLAKLYGSAISQASPFNKDTPLKPLINKLVVPNPQERYRKKGATVFHAMTEVLIDSENKLAEESSKNFDQAQKNKITLLFKQARQVREYLFRLSHSKPSRFASPKKHKMEVFGKICKAIGKELNFQDSNSDRWNDNNIEIFIRMLDIDYVKDCKTKKEIQKKIQHLQDRINNNHERISTFQKYLKTAKEKPNNYFKRNLKQYYVELQTLEHQLADYQHKLSKCKTLDDFVELKDKGDRVLARINAILNPNSEKNSQSDKHLKSNKNSEKNENSKESNTPKTTATQNDQTEPDYAGLISRRLLKSYKKPDQHLNAQAISLQIKKLNPKEQDIYLRLEVKAAQDSRWSPFDSRLEVNLKYYHSIFFRAPKNAQKTAENHEKNAQSTKKTTQPTNNNHTDANLIDSDKNQDSTNSSNNQIDQAQTDQKHILALLTLAHAQERSWTYKIFKFLGVREADDIQHNIKVIHALVAEFLKQSSSNHDNEKNSPSSSDQTLNQNISFRDFLVNNLSRLKLMKRSKDENGRVFYEELDSELIKILTDKKGINITLAQIKQSTPKPAPENNSSPSGNKSAMFNQKQTNISGGASNIKEKKGSQYLEENTPPTSPENRRGK